MNVNKTSTNLQAGQFQKGANAEVRGKTFQIYNTILCLFKALLEQLDDWKLSSENQLAGKFDDVVLEWNKRSLLIQIKYKQDREIGFDELFSTNSLNNYNLVTYFLSYLEVKSKFQVPDVIICSNATIWTKMDEEKFLKNQIATSGNILSFQEQDCWYYTLDDELVPFLKKHVMDYLRGKNQTRTTISFTDDDIKDFFQHLQVYYDYPCDIHLRNVIKTFLPRIRLSRGIFYKMSLQDIFFKVMEWYKNPKGKCKHLTELEVKAWSTQVSVPIAETSTFTKDGDMGITSMMFHVQLITVCFLNALRKYNMWNLSFNNKAFGKFDKVVLERPDELLAIQTNYKKRDIAFANLLSASSKNNSFSLSKLFLRYQITKLTKIKKFADVDIIICTNVNVTVDKHRQKFLKTRTATSDSILYCPGSDHSYYTIDEALVPFLKESVKKLLEILKLTDKYEGIVTDDNIKDFMQHLQIYYNYPCDLRNVIKELLPPIKICKKISPQDVTGRVMEWFEREGPCEYLTELFAKTMFSEIISKKYCDELDQYNVLFKSNDLDFDELNRVVLFNFKNGYLVHAIKIFRALQHNGIEALYIDPYEDVDVQLQVVEAFHQPRYECLVMIWPETPPQDVIIAMYKKLKNTLKVYDHKKVILVGRHEENLISQLGIDSSIYQITMGNVAISDFITETQTDLLKRKIIDLHGNIMSLEDIYSIKGNNYVVLWHNILDKVVRGVEIVATLNVYHMNINGVDQKVLVLTADDIKETTISSDLAQEVQLLQIDKSK